jgi:acyl-CoA reductase LuxC
MSIKNRIDLLANLGAYLSINNEELQAVKEKAQWQNAWFTQEFIDLSIKNIAENFLQRRLLENWVNQYQLENNIQPKRVGIVMAGNIPLVGFHDFLCVFISGHKAIMKPSSKDEVLIKHLAGKIFEWNEEAKNCLVFAENLKNCDAYIATGSNNSSRYFEYYFGKYPNIIRRNRTSAAILAGDENEDDLELLADDIQQYYGMGCRNVTHLFVPADYDFVPLLNALKKYDYFKNFYKYRNNYDYYLALLILNNKFYMTNESIILTENENVFAPVSQLNYSYYNDIKILEKSLAGNQDLQCIIGKNFIPFGKSQSPALGNYADGVDTMQFLKQL